MSQLKTRVLEDTDYDMLVSWWNKNRFPVPPKEILPDNGLGGIMVQSNGIDVCAGFLYLTNSKICWLEFIVANFDYRESDRKEAIALTIKRLCEIAKEMGYMAIFTSVKNRHLVQYFENIGFSKDSTIEMALKL